MLHSTAAQLEYLQSLNTAIQYSLRTGSFARELGKREKKDEGEGGGEREGKGKWACRDDIQRAFTPTCQNSFEVSRWYRTMTAKQVWRDVFSGQTDRSLLRRLFITPNKPVRIGRKEIGPSYNDYCRLCGLCFQCTIREYWSKHWLWKLFKPQLQEISCGVVQLFTAQFCAEQ